VEVSPETWWGLGFGQLGQNATLHKLEHVFEAALDGHRLVPQAGSHQPGPWGNFVVVRNQRWHLNKVALMGDAAHTTHFTVGSGTRLAMEDAMAVTDVLATQSTLQDRRPPRRQH
jgi:anthraniloyl-CoA monooxygenase